VPASGAVFSKFIGNKGLWSSVFQLQVRIKEDPLTERCFAHDELVALKGIFLLRHELVHDPARRAYFSGKILEDMWSAAHLIFGSDVVLTQAIQANRDPALNNYWRKKVVQTASLVLGTIVSCRPESEIDVAQSVTLCQHKRIA
jgi:hypothetical protein